MLRAIFVGALLALLPCPAFSAQPAPHAWELQEIVLRSSRHYDNPYVEVECWVELKGPGFAKRVYGFWDGGDLFRVRVVATAPGAWSWTSGSNQAADTGLNGKSGGFTAREWTEEERRQNPNRRGFLRPDAKGHALQYADGTPFFLLGDTWLGAVTWRLPLTGRPADPGYEAAPGVSFEEAVALRKRQGFNSVSMIAAFPTWDSDQYPATYADKRGVYYRNAWEAFGVLVAGDKPTAKAMHDERGYRPFEMVPGSEGLPNYDRVVPEFFRSLDAKMQHLAAQGFVAMLETVRRDVAPPWKAYFDFDASYTRFVQYMVARYGAHNMIFSKVHFDIYLPNYSLTAAEFNAAITHHYRKYGPMPFGQPVTALIDHATDTTFGVGDAAPWITMHSTGNKPRDHAIYAALERQFRLSPPVPTADLEPHYTGWVHGNNVVNGEQAEPGSDRDNYFSRAQMYGCVLSGGLAGHVHGTGAYDVTSAAEPPGGRPYFWQALRYASAEYMRGLGIFMLSEGPRYRDLQLASGDLSARKAAGSSETGLDGWSFLMRTPDQSLGMLYFENKAQRGQARGWRPDRDYRLAWFDPRAGEWRQSIDLRSDATGTIDLPPFPGGHEVAPTDWAAKIVVREKARPLLDQVFQDHAVLQRDRAITIRGEARPGERVDVALGAWRANARADASGRWSATLPAMPAGGPYTLEARGESGAIQSASDVLVGDVWLCSGQSNMEFPVARSRNGDLAVAGSADDTIRLLTVTHKASPAPDASFDGPVAWQVAAPQAVRSFSAACYYFARELRQSVRVPTGLINASWGGSAIEAWMAESGLRAAGGFEDRLDLLPLYVRDADVANRSLGRMWEEWWRAHAPDAGEPWQPAADASRWRDVPEPMRNWKTWGVPELANHDGMVWYRRSFRLTSEQAAQAATLSLGGIDEVDETWVNGRAIRNTFGWGTERTYRLPAGVLHAGENVVVVNVLSTWDAGGMLGPADRLAVAFDDGTKVSLGGGWRYQVVPPGVGRPPRAPWESIAGLTSLYNGMIAPLGPYGLRGVAWYQGETNADAPAGYEALLAGLMSGWRAQFGADLPFLVVQLPGFGPVPAAPAESGWADIREAQRRAVARDAHAGLAVTIDLGERGDIHPINKREVGSRLARAARRVVYGEAVSSSGPVPASATREPGRVVVKFDEVEGGLVAYSAGQAIGFELCGTAKGSCSFAGAAVDGNRVVLPLSASGDDVPARVRFCWGASPLCNLSDGSGLPVGPFEIAVK